MLAKHCGRELPSRPEPSASSQTRERGRVGRSVLACNHETLVGVGRRYISRGRATRLKRQEIRRMSVACEPPKWRRHVPLWCRSPIPNNLSNLDDKPVVSDLCRSVSTSNAGVRWMIGQHSARRGCRASVSWPPSASSRNDRRRVGAADVSASDPGRPDRSASNGQVHIAVTLVAFWKLGSGDANLKQSLAGARAPSDEWAPGRRGFGRAVTDGERLALGAHARARMRANASSCM